MTFYLTIKGGTEMNYRIEDKPSFTIAGIKKEFPFSLKGSTLKSRQCGNNWMNKKLVN